MSAGTLHKQSDCRNTQTKKCLVFVLVFFVLQEEGDFLCLPGGSDTQGQHRNEGRGQRTEGDHHRKVCSFVLRAAVTESKMIAK